MGYIHVIVCITVIKSDERVLFYPTGSMSSDKSDHWEWIVDYERNLCVTVLIHVFGVTTKLIVLSKC